MAKTKMRFRELARMLLEDGAPIDPTDPQPLPMEVQNLSLDMKVDNYLMKYENESLPTQQTYTVPGSDLGMAGPPQPTGGTGVMSGNPGFNGVGLTEFQKVAQRLLREADGDDPAVGGDDPAADPGADPTAGGGDAAPAGGAPAGPPAVENPRFNVRNFAQSVARLTLNYEGLLDPRTTILNRARAYVEKNYDAGLARQMMEILESQFQLSPANPQENGGINAPVAAGSWQGGGGGGGG